MRQTTILSIGGLILAAMFSCTREPVADTQISLNSSIVTAGTRAPQLAADGSGRFETSDKVGVWAVVSGSVSDKCSNIQCPANGASGLFWDDVSTSTEVSFTAYYPWKAGITAAKNYIFTPSTAADGDLLLAAPVKATFAKPAPVIAFQFRHAMHKLVVNLQCGTDYLEEDLKAASVSVLGLLPSAEIDLLASEVVKASGMATTVTNKAGTTSRVFLVAPQGVTSGAGFISIEVPNRSTNDTVTYLFRVPATVTQNGVATVLTSLEEGKSLRLNLLISKSGIRLTSGEIVAWQIQGNVNGDSHYIYTE